MADASGEFDYIVIGGGSAGSAVTGRLAEDGTKTVCLLEAGGRNNGIRVRTPGLFPFLPDSANYKFETVPQKGLKGRIGYQPRGRGLGGSSAINAMVYIRGNAWDYDNWARALGCDGWAYEDVLPFFKRSEDNVRGGGPHHGRAGPLGVSDQLWANPTSHAFVEAASQLQLPVTDDFNGAEQPGFGLYQVTQRDGERCTASHAYVEPLRGKPNLDIRTNTMVQRLIIENGRVTGVAIQRGGNNEIVRARYGVVLSAGAFNSPQILMLSGIGPGEHLREHGIDITVDKDAVGSELQDHIDYVSSWEVASTDTIGDSLTATFRMAKAIIQHRFTKKGIMTTPYAEAGGFWSVMPDSPAPDVQWHFVPAMLEDHGREKVKGHGFSLHACVLRPESRGTVRLNSAKASDAPRIDPNFLDDDRDLAVLREGIRLSHRIAAAPALADYAPKDRYAIDLQDDAALDALIRERSDTVYHPVGTCRMGPDEDSVVDTRLKARGVDGLWIADASIMPKIVSGNTNAPSIMIGERCAEFIKEAHA